MTKYFSWYHEWRDEDKEPEKLEEERQQARQELAVWRDNDACTFNDEILHGIAYLRLEESLLHETAALFQQRYPAEEYEWVYGDAIYGYYAIYYTQVRKYTEARKWALMALEHKDSFHKDRYTELMAICAIESGDLEDAYVWLEKLMKMQEPDYYNWFHYIRFYLSAHNAEKALQLLDEIPKKYTHVLSEIHFYRGRAYFLLNDFEKARDFFQQHLDLHAASVEGLFYMGVTYANAFWDNDTTIGYYLRALEVAIEDEAHESWFRSIYHHLSTVYANGGKFKEALHYLRKYYEATSKEEIWPMYQQLFDTMPELNEENASSIFCTVYNFCESLLKPGFIEALMEQQPDNLQSEVRHAAKAAFDWGQLTDVNESQAN